MFAADSGSIYTSEDWSHLHGCPLLHLCQEAAQVKSLEPGDWRWLTDIAPPWCLLWASVLVERQSPSRMKWSTAAFFFDGSLLQNAPMSLTLQGKLQAIKVKWHEARSEARIKARCWLRQRVIMQTRQICNLTEKMWPMKVHPNPFRKIRAWAVSDSWVQCAPYCESYVTSAFPMCRRTELMRCSTGLASA